MVTGYQPIFNVPEGMEANTASQAPFNILSKSMQNPIKTLDTPDRC